MLRSFISRISIFPPVLLLAALSFPRFLQAQTILPRAGQNFTFGIPEGSDKLIGPGAEQETQLLLTVASAYSGCGVMSSPSGYTLNFSFQPGQATVIVLPYDLMQLNDLGKSNKGILVHTTAPVNLTLHDYIPDAGDATQILPDDALDTSYVAFGWGIWDDPTDSVPERNTNQLLVTASQDSTLLTIVPSVNTLLGQSANVPVTVLLNRGECYIEKADTSDHPSDPSLSGSRVTATKPISVISGLTCAYVPVGVESCNELLDELIGKKWWGSHFFVQPLGNSDPSCVLVLTSDRNFYASFNTGLSNSVNGRLVATFGGTAEIRTFDINNNPILVEAQQLTRGNSNPGAFEGDPTLVTVLDTSYYDDTLVWNTPALPFSEDWVPIVYPTRDASAITLDGVPLNNVGAVSSIINKSAYSAINPAIVPGEHTLRSPDPLFALVTGFDIADAYSFVAGTAGSPVPRDTVSHAVLLTADSATTCSEFTITASLAGPINSSENVLVLTIPISYDPGVLHLLSLLPGTLLTNSNFSVDSSTPGNLLVSVSGNPFITGGDLFQLVFQGWKPVEATTVGHNSQPSICGDDSEIVVVQPVTFAIAPPDSLSDPLTLSCSGAELCEPMTLSITTDSDLSLSDSFTFSKIEIAFDTSKLQFVSSASGALLNAIVYTQQGGAAGNYTLAVTNPTALSGSDSLLTLTLDPSQLTAATTIQAQVFYIRCGDTIVKMLTVTFPISTAIDAGHTALTVTTTPVSLGNQESVNVALAGLPATANVYQFDLALTYNHDVLMYDHADLSNTLTATWPTPEAVIGTETDTLYFTSFQSLSFTPGTLALLWFRTFAADSSYSPITITSSLNAGDALCPLAYRAQGSALFSGQNLCGDSVLREFLLGQPILLTRAQITDGNLDISISLPTTAPVSLALFDLLGREVWSAQFSATTGKNDRTFSLPETLPNGPLTLQARTGERSLTRELILVR